MTSELIDPIEKEIEGSDGKKKLFRIGKVPYLDGGRQICSQYIPTAAPKIGNYKENEDLARAIFKYVEYVDSSGNKIRLITDDLVNSHVNDFMLGVNLEVAALEHNMGFSVLGKLSEYQEGFLTRLPDMITEILTKLLQSSQETESVTDKN